MLVGKSEKAFGKSEENGQVYYIYNIKYSMRNTYIIVVDSYLFLPPRIGSCVIQINKMFRFFQTNQMSISKER